jgi:hypothetical protein
MLKIFIKERKFKWIMDDKITKKTVIYIIILILLIGGYLTYLILQNTVFNENIKELYLLFITSVRFLSSSPSE